jgi:hypothetical protein
MVKCGYCHTTTRVGSTRRHRNTETHAPGASRSRIVGFAIFGLVCTGAIAAFVAQSRSPTTVSEREPVTTPSTTWTRSTPSTPSIVEPAPPPEPPPDPLKAVTVTSPDAPTAPAHTPKRKADPAPTGPIVTKKEAEEILRPQVLACMKQAGVHYLITRLGNERRGANVPALGLTGTSIVDYKPTPGFATTPLGRCVARAGSAVRAPAYSGNYIYFGLRDDSIADPLADAPARLDTKAAKQALEALDDEARDCTRRSPSGSRPGESVSVLVYFGGASGEVTKVEPYYVDHRSAYGSCLAAVYRKATVGKFRDIEGKVVHVLSP